MPEEAILAEDAYLTDGKCLFRCLGGDGAMILLEDCMSLETIAFPRAELARPPMRPVKRIGRKGRKR